MSITPGLNQRGWEKNERSETSSRCNGSDCVISVRATSESPDPMLFVIACFDIMKVTHTHVHPYGYIQGAPMYIICAFELQMKFCRDFHERLVTEYRILM